MSVFLHIKYEREGLAATNFHLHGNTRHMLPELRVAGANLANSPKPKIYLVSNDIKQRKVPTVFDSSTF